MYNFHALRVIAVSLKSTPKILDFDQEKNFFQQLSFYTIYFMCPWEQQLVEHSDEF